MYALLLYSDSFNSLPANTCVQPRLANIYVGELNDALFLKTVLYCYINLWPNVLCCHLSSDSLWVGERTLPMHTLAALIIQ